MQKPNNVDTINKIRYILNLLFLVAAIATFILYFAASGTIFLYTGLAAITFKMIEFILRFMF